MPFCNRLQRFHFKLYHATDSLVHQMYAYNPLNHIKKVRLSEI